MSSVWLKPDVELRTYRCVKCGRWYGVEPGDGGCPRCIGKRLSDERNRVSERDRTIAALRGVITRLRKRLGAGDD